MTGVEGVGHVPAEWQNGSANGLQVFLALQRAEHFVDEHLESLGAGRGQPSLERFSEQGMQVVFVAVLRGFVHVTPSLLCLDFVDERQFNHRYDWLIWKGQRLPATPFGASQVILLGLRWAAVIPKAR